MNTQVASLWGSKLSSAYNSLRGEIGAPQTATDTIEKLVEKIQTSAAVEDRRTAVLGLKGLSRDWKEDVGSRAMSSLIAVLQHDAPYDTDIAKATLETLMQLCEAAEKPTKDDVGLRFTDQFLEEPLPLHSLLALLSNSPSFYPRFYSLQFLSQLLSSRATVAQSYLMSAPPPGIEGVLAVLDPQKPSLQPGTGGASMGGGASEMLRNEALLLFPALLGGNGDLQKIVAFSGAFEKLFQIINQEGGTDGGIVVQDALTVLSGLLRFNVSNQNFFRESSLIPAIPPILGFPPNLPADTLSPDEFALQYWPEQKIFNAGLVLGMIRTLIGGPGGPNQSAMVSSGVTRTLLEIALASNAPNGLKSQALNTLTPILSSSTPNQSLLNTLSIAPLVPIHADEDHPNGGFVRLPPKPAVIALVAAVVDGDASAGGRGLRGRAAGVNMFEAFVTGNDDARIDILTSMTPPGGSHPEPTAGAIILSGLLDLPSGAVQFDPYRPLFASLLLSHLVRNSEHAKKLARELSLPGGGDADSAIEDDDDNVSLVQLVVGNLMMAEREHTECVNRAAKDGVIPGSTEEEDWTRVMVGYLVLLCTWLWDSPKTVKEFLSESANLQILIQPITQTTGIDPLVQGLSAFLLGVCYEFNREPGEITRATLYPILHSRIGPDQFVSRMARLREDPRFKAVQPDAFDTEGTPEIAPVEGDEVDEGLELWFDWAFVDFWKNHYYTIQRSIAVDPDAVRGSAASDDGETAAMIMSLRQKLKSQTDEVVALQSKLSGLSNEHSKEKDTLVNEIQSLSDQVSSLTASLSTTQSSSASHTAELASLRDQLASSERTRSEASKAERRTLQGVRDELSSAREELKEVRKKHEAELKALRDEVSAKNEDLEGLRKEFDVEKSKGVKAVEEQRSKLEQEGESAKSKHQDELKSLTGKYEKELSDLKAAHDKALKAKDAELATATAAATSGGGGGGKGKGKNKAANDELTAAAKSRTAEVEKELEEEKQKREEVEKEHEDLLVLLEELSQKRKKDKAKLKDAGVEVSDDEEEDEDGAEDVEE